MKAEDQNKAICKAIGKEYKKPTEAEISGGSYYQYEPDFTRSLDLMHEAELELSLNQHDGYRDWLMRIAQTTAPWGVITATAAQRAEAFLKTIDKWTDTDPKAREGG